MGFNQCFKDEVVDQSCLWLRRWCEVLKRDYLEDHYQPMSKLVASALRLPVSVLVAFVVCVPKSCTNFLCCILGMGTGMEDPRCWT